MTDEIPSVLLKLTKYTHAIKKYLVFFLGCKKVL